MRCTRSSQCRPDEAAAASPSATAARMLPSACREAASPGCARRRFPAAPVVGPASVSSRPSARQTATLAHWLADGASILPIREARRGVSMIGEGGDGALDCALKRRCCHSPGGRRGAAGFTKRRRHQAYSPIIAYKTRGRIGSASAIRLSRRSKQALKKPPGQAAEPLPPSCLLRRGPPPTALAASEEASRGLLRTITGQMACIREG